MCERRRGPISLGDTLRVEAALRPRDAATREAVEALLGAERSAPPAKLVPSAGPWKQNEPKAAPAPGAAPSAGRAKTAPADSGESVPAAAPPRLAGSAVASRHLGRTSFAPPAWLMTADSFSPLAGGNVSLPPPPIFDRLRSRAILGAALATFTAGSEVDLERATAALAAGRRLQRIPYRPVPTLGRGAQVLVDRARALDPLRLDLVQLLADLELLFGPGRLEVLSFAHCPSASDARRRGVWAESGGRRAWRAPARGMPVLVVSDFAASPAVDDDEDVATPGEWLQFARQVRADFCHPVALTPYPPSRWQPALARLLSFVHWSERTTARQVMRAVREARMRAAAGGYR